MPNQSSTWMPRDEAVQRRLCLVFAGMIRRMFIGLMLSAPLLAVADKGIESYPCVKETAVLMEITSSWPQLYEAANVMPNHCFDGYFAEGISGTLVWKMGQAWSGFVSQLSRKGSGDHFLPLVLKSINETLILEDVEKVKDFAEHSCSRQVENDCSAILKRIEEVFWGFL